MEQCVPWSHTHIQACWTREEQDFMFCSEFPKDGGADFYGTKRVKATADEVQETTYEEDTT